MRSSSRAYRVLRSGAVNCSCSVHDKEGCWDVTIRAEVGTKSKTAVSVVFEDDTLLRCRGGVKPAIPADDGSAWLGHEFEAHVAVPKLSKDGQKSIGLSLCSYDDPDDPECSSECVGRVAVGGWLVDRHG